MVNKINIFGYWYDSEFTDFVKKSIKKTINNNPYLQYNIYNDKQSKLFLKKFFNKDVLDAYNILKPYAYKSDLIRYCLLYIYGGIYMDLKLILNPINKVFFINNEYHFAKNRRLGKKKWKTVENSFLYFKKPKNPILKKIIIKITRNVIKRNKTSHKLYLTGPILLGEYFKNIKPTLLFTGIFKPKRKFIYSYNDYNIINNKLDDYYRNQTHQNYWKLWDNNNVFN